MERRRDVLLSTANTLNPGQKSDVPYFLAIDAGGTKAEYVLADETRVLARTRSDTLKRLRTTADIATANLAGALAKLQQASGIHLRHITRTCIGTAGNTVPLVTDFLRAEIGSRVGGSLLVLGDVEIALDAAFPNASGVLVLAGTGSNVAGRASTGKLLGAGGYGPVLSDQGSGHRIGYQALRALYLALDEGRPTTLLDAVLTHWALADADALVGYANTCPYSQFSTLSQIVLTCAEAGDAVSNEVLQDEARELAHLAILIHRRIAAIDGPAWTPQFAFAGSILHHVRPLRRALIDALIAETGNPEFKGLVEPIEGALWRARQPLIPKLH